MTNEPKMAPVPATGEKADQTMKSTTDAKATVVPAESEKSKAEDNKS